MTTAESEPDPVFDENFINAGHREASAEERLAKAQRIAREHQRLERAGEIASGTGKPAFHRRRRRNLGLALAAVAAALIVIVAIVVTRT